MKLILKLLVGALGVALALVAALAAYLFSTALTPARPVGFQQATVADPGHAPIAVDIWYPTSARPGFVLLGATGERVASGGAVMGRGLPLVVISHGTGGGPMSHADTALALAAAGFVVAAPAHTGDNLRDDSAVGTSAWLPDRARHVARVTDFMLKDWKDHDRLNGRVGVFGFSAGATTALIAAGGTPDLGRVAGQCAAHPEFVCRLRKPGAVLANPAAGWPQDARIGAVAVAAPGLGFAFEPGGLSGVRAPVQLWSGSQDQAVPYATNAGVVRRLLPSPPEFHEAAGAAHTSFLAPCGLIGPPRICRDAKGFDRAAFHRRFNDTVARFFKAHLATR